MHEKKTLKKVKYNKISALILKLHIEFLVPKILNIDFNKQLFQKTMLKKPTFQYHFSDIDPIQYRMLREISG